MVPMMIILKGVAHCGEVELSATWLCSYFGHCGYFAGSTVCSLFFLPVIKTSSGRDSFRMQLFNLLLILCFGGLPYLQEWRYWLPPGLVFRYIHYTQACGALVGAGGGRHGGQFSKLSFHIFYHWFLDLSSRLHQRVFYIQSLARLEKRGRNYGESCLF